MRLCDWLLAAYFMVAAALALWGQSAPPPGAWSAPSPTLGATVPLAACSAALMTRFAWRHGVAAVASLIALGLSVPHVLAPAILALGWLGGDWLGERVSSVDRDGRQVVAALAALVALPLWLTTAQVWTLRRRTRAPRAKT